MKYLFRFFCGPQANSPKLGIKCGGCSAFQSSDRKIW